VFLNKRSQKPLGRFSSHPCVLGFCRVRDAKLGPFCVCGCLLLCGPMRLGALQRNAIASSTLLWSPSGLHTHHLVCSVFLFWDYSAVKCCDAGWTSLAFWMCFNTRAFLLSP
jgi:hypothetical protein